MANIRITQCDNQSIPVYNNEGKQVGEIEGDSLIKHVRFSRHYFKKVGGWAWDTHVIEQAESMGVTSTIIYDDERHKVYKVSLADFRWHGVPICYAGYEPQICLPLPYWKANPMSRRRPRRSRGAA